MILASALLPKDTQHLQTSLAQSYPIVFFETVTSLFLRDDHAKRITVVLFELIIDEEVTLRFFYPQQRHIVD